MFIDTHCHLDLPPLVGQLDLLLKEARLAGITKWVVPAVHPDGWQRISELGSTFPDLYPAYGIHPRHAAVVQPGHLQLLDQLAPQGVALGEIGLDGTLDAFDQQILLFRAQLRIALRHGLPVLIHCRKAIGRTLAILHEEHADEVGGIMHAFSGSLESARACIKLGFVISLTGTLTRQNAVRSLQLARELALDHMVLETDAPDLTPANHYGVPNRPAWLLDVARTLAAVRGCTLAEIAEATSATAQRILPLH
jgi:TatD DNase family protein